MLNCNNAKQDLSEDTLFNRYEELVNRDQLQSSIAVVDIAASKQHSYGELLDESNLLSRFIVNQSGAKNKSSIYGPGKLIGVLSEKGYNPVVATLSIMRSGHGYLPLSVDWPTNRLDDVLEQGNVTTLLISEAQYNQEEVREYLSKKYQLLVIEEVLLKIREDKELRSKLLNISPPKVKADDIAYVIFTSGSTGKPKGVTISHRGALNTIDEVNKRFNVSKEDRVLALSELSFDLSVYDIYGLLAVGGTIVFPEQDKAKDSSHWLDLVNEHKITIWNTVPTLADLLIDEANDSAVNPEYLRLFLLSGDWISLNLPPRIKECCPKAIVMSLGGATEGSIWSIWYEIDKIEDSWSSIPYGAAMPNQKMYVLDHAKGHNPIGVIGEIYIGGLGVALSYWNDDEKTQASFIEHNELGRLYKTGDLGRYLEDGNIEFLGRTDNQVKIRGFRIELGEIESTIQSVIGVKQCVVLAREDVENQKRLVGYVVLESIKKEKEVINKCREICKSKLPDYMQPSQIVILESLPLTPSGKVDRKALPAPEGREGLNTEFHGLNPPLIF